MFGLGLGIGLGLRGDGGPSGAESWLSREAILWLDPDVGLVSSGGLVSQISDRSLNRNHATASGADRPPVDSINGRTAYLLDGGDHNPPALTTAVTTAQCLFLVYDRTGLPDPPSLSVILGTLLGDGLGFDFAGGATQPNMFDGIHTSVNLESVSQGGTAEIRVNGEWSEIWNESSPGPGPIIKPVGPSVITLMCGGNVRFANLGMDRITSRLDHSRRRDLVALASVPAALISSIEGLLLAKSGIVPTLAQRVIVFSGDSLTAGTGAAAGHDYPTLTLAKLNDPSVWKGNGAYISYRTRMFNVGVGGKNEADLLLLDLVGVDRKLSAFHPVNVVIGNAGSNDLARTPFYSPADSVALAEAWYLARKYADPSAIVGIGTTVTRSDYGSGTPADFYALAAARNAGLKASQIIPASAIVDFAANPYLAPGWETDVAKSADLVHGNDASYDAGWATTAAAWVNTVAP